MKVRDVVRGPAFMQVPGPRKAPKAGSSPGHFFQIDAYRALKPDLVGPANLPSLKDLTFRV